MSKKLISNFNLAGFVYEANRRGLEAAALKLGMDFLLISYDLFFFGGSSLPQKRAAKEFKKAKGTVEKERVHIPQIVYKGAHL